MDREPLDVTNLPLIIETGLTDLSIQVRTAKLLIDVHLANKTFEDCESLGNDELELIELYLCAHIISVTELQERYQKIGEAAASYKEFFGQNLRSTSWGQMACVLDRTGTLRNLGNVKAKVRSV